MVFICRPLSGKWKRTSATFAPAPPRLVKFMQMRSEAYFIGVTPADGTGVFSEGGGEYIFNFWYFDIIFALFKKKAMAHELQNFDPICK